MIMSPSQSNQEFCWPEFAHYYAVKTSNTTSVDDSDNLQFDQLVLKNTYKKCELSGAVLSLTDSEFDLLWLLASNPDTPLSRDYLTQTLRGIEYDGIDRTIDNKVVRLRKILGRRSRTSRENSDHSR